MTGGCQCGAIRYSVQGGAADPAICHCRMCQKAVGSIFWPYFSVRAADLKWTRGQVALYRSSAAAQRGFCAACGTPLTFQRVGSEKLDLSLGSLDDPARVRPASQHWAEARMPWFRDLADLPEVVTNKSEAEIARRKPYQHPDHDTAEWPPAGRSP
jgi:hypothetical protein